LTTAGTSLPLFSLARRIENGFVTIRFTRAVLCSSEPDASPQPMLTAGGNCVLRSRMARAGEFT